MFKLPYVPAPYPDEILGSWLARTALHNGSGAWRCLLEASGFGRRIESPFLDIPAYSDKLVNLARALGTNYERIINELTTYPYWLAFDAENLSAGVLNGTFATPKIALRNQNRSDAPPRALGISRHQGKAFRPRYCSQCLCDDLIDCGEPYWHKAHQLPNVLFCARHHRPLQTRCQSCGLVASRVSKQLIELPKLRCTCGHDMRRDSRQTIPSEAYVRLADISAQALKWDQLQWDRHQVRAHMLSLMASNSSSKSQKLLRVLGKSFNVKPFSQNLIELLPPAGFDDSIFLRGHFSQLRAPECCALLVAIGTRFDEAATAFKIAAAYSKARRHDRIDTAGLTVKSARKAINRWVAARPGLAISTCTTVYWFLRFYDLEWFTRRFPKVVIDRSPSIYQDRQGLQKLVSSYSKNQMINPMTTAAAVRARLRDEAWLRNLLAERTAKTRQIVQSNRSSRIALRIEALERALDSILKTEGRPSRVNAVILGRMTGLSQSQAGDVIRAYQPLREAIDAANRDKVQRQLLWAARRLQAEGRPLFMRSISARAGLPRNSETNPLMREIIRSISAHADELLGGSKDKA